MESPQNRHLGFATGWSSDLRTFFRKHVEQLKEGTRHTNVQIHAHDFAIFCFYGGSRRAKVGESSAASKTQTRRNFIQQLLKKTAVPKRVWIEKTIPNPKNNTTTSSSAGEIPNLCWSLICRYTN